MGRNDATDHCEGDQPQFHEPGAPDEVARARQALAEHDLPRAARHLADAFALDPRLPEIHETLTQLVTAAGGVDPALEHFPLEPDQPFIGTAAATAHLHAGAGRWDEAVQLLADVAANEPHRPWLDVAWLHRPDLADLVSPTAVAMAVVRVVPNLPDRVDQPQRAPLFPLLSLLRATIARHRDHSTLLWCGATLAGRLGAVEEAVAWATRSYQLEPSHQAAVVTGNSLRRAGRPEEALRVWQQEIERAPGELDLYVDVASLLDDLDRAEEGLAWAERAAKQDHTHPRAVPAVHYLRYSVDQDARHLIALADHLQCHPDHVFAAELLARRSHRQPWLGAIPEPTESVINLLRHLLADTEPSADRDLELTVSALEPPSAILALHRAFPRATVHIQSTPKPDLRRPLHRVRHEVWTYRGTTARPAVRPPSPSAAEAVRQAATLHWTCLPAAYDHAITLSHLDPTDLLGVLAHPPAPPADDLGAALTSHAPHLWVRAVQTWACLGLTHHRTDQPWPTSTRRAMLADLLNGPEDWVSESAALALIATAWADPHTRADVADLIGLRLIKAVTAHQQREVTILGSLCRLALITPELPAQCTALARDVLHRIEAD